MTNDDPNDDPMLTVLDAYAKSGAPVTLRLKGDFSPNGQPIGPGLLKQTERNGLYLFEMPVMVGQSGKQPRPGTMPVHLRASDVLWISLGVQVPEEPVVLAPPGARSPGGIYT